MSNNQFETPETKRRATTPPRIGEKRHDKSYDKGDLPSLNLNLTFVEASSIFPENPYKTPCVSRRNSTQPPHLIRIKNPNKRDARGKFVPTMLFSNVPEKTEA
jgi:hypothetical protein